MRKCLLQVVRLEDFDAIAKAVEGVSYITFKVMLKDFVKVTQLSEQYIYCFIILILLQI